MRILAAIFVTSLVVRSCESKTGQTDTVHDTLKDCDQVELLYYHPNDTLRYAIRDTAELHVLRNLVSKDKETIGDSCEPSGALVYITKNRAFLTAEFSTFISGRTCNYITYKFEDQSYTHKLSPAAANFFNDFFRKIMSSTEAIRLDSLRSDTIKKKLLNKNNR